MTAELRLRELLDRLAIAEVRFVIVGRLAVNAWGHVRGPQDVDLVPDPERGNLDRLASVLEEAGGRVETAQWRRRRRHPILASYVSSCIAAQAVEPCEERARVVPPGGRDEAAGLSP